MPGWSRAISARTFPASRLVVVQNLPGAGSRRLANVLSNVGPHDGTMIGLPNQGIAMDQALGAEGVQYDARKFRWIGSPIEDVNVLWAWHTNPVKTVEDAKQREFVAGATGPGSPTTFYPRIMNTVLGTKFKIVPGYPGSNELDLAIEKGEVGGRVVGWSSLKITSDFVATGKANVLLQFGLRKASDLPNVRLLQDLAANDKDRQIFEYLGAGRGDGTAVLHVGRHVGGARRGHARGLRRHHEGPGLSRGGRAFQARDRSALRRRAHRHCRQDVRSVGRRAGRR